MDRDRVDRWLLYIDELDEQDQRQVARERAAETKAAGRALAKAIRTHYTLNPGGRQKHRPR